MATKPKAKAAPPAKKAPPKRKPAVKKLRAAPRTWYFDTGDPNVVLACDYNAADKHYNKNCRPVARPKVGPEGLSKPVMKAAANPPVGRADAARAGAPAMAARADGIPPVWYFDTADPNTVIVCDYNPQSRQYDRNCRPIPRP